MLRIPSDYRRRKIPKHIWGHLYPIGRREHRQYVSYFTFFFLDLFCILPLIGDTVVKELLIFIIPMILVINIWAVTLLIRNPYSTQIETLVFMGCCGIVGMISSFVIAQKSAYTEMNFQSPVYFILSLLTYISVIMYFIYYYNTKMAINRKRKRKKHHFNIFIAGAPALGYNFYHGFIKGSPFLHFFMSLIYLLFLGTLFIYIAARFFHKLYFINLNKDFFELNQPSKKERKQAQANGKEIMVK